MKDLSEWTNRDYWLWLLSIPGLYRSQISSLIQYFGSPKEIYLAPAGEYEVFARLGLKWIRNVPAAKEVSFLQKIQDKMDRTCAQFVFIDEEAYPGKLRNLPDAPYGLFYRGNLPKEDLYTVAIVGARACSAYGQNMASEISRLAAECGMQVVSGMALGIDGIAQSTCLECGGRSYAVLGCGVDRCYPPEHLSLLQSLIEKGGVLSEFPIGTAPLKIHFPMRNRIISALSDAVIVVEAREKSGSLITADMALDQGKEVYAVPGRSIDVLSFGCNRLIEESAAQIVLSPRTLMDDLKEHAKQQGKLLNEAVKRKTTAKNPAGKAFTKSALAPDEERVYSFLDLSPFGTEALQRATGLSFGALSAALWGLEVKGLAKQIGQNQYVKGDPIEK